MGILNRIFNNGGKVDALPSSSLLDNPLPDLRKILGFDGEAVEPTLQTIAPIMAMFPGSVRHHHSVEGGLLTHSLEVAGLCVENLKTVKPDHNGQEKVGAYLVGLLHDLGKIAFYKTSGGYKFNPLLFQSNDKAEILKEQIPHKENAHAEVSAMVMFSLLSDEVKGYPISILTDMFHAIRCHHSKRAEKNIFSIVLEMSDHDSVAQNVQEITGQQAVETPAPQNKSDKMKPETSPVSVLLDPISDDKETSKPEPEQTSLSGDTAKWIEVLRNKMLYDLKKDFEFYLLTYEDKQFIGLVYPACFNKICSGYSEITGKDIHPDLLLNVLKNSGLFLFGTVSKVGLEGKGFKASRTLNMVCIDADKALVGEEYGFFESQFKVKRLSGQ